MSLREAEGDEAIQSKKFWIATSAFGLLAMTKKNVGYAGTGAALCPSDPNASIRKKIKLANGTIATIMPHHPGFPLFSATPIQTRMLITRFTIGIKNKKIHHHGFPAICIRRIRLAIGIIAIIKLVPNSLPVFFAIIARQNAQKRYAAIKKMIMPIPMPADCISYVVELYSIFPLL